MLSPTEQARYSRHLLIPEVGYTGAAWATLIAYGVAAVLEVAVFVRLSGLPLSELLRIRRDDVADYMTAAKSIVQGRRLRTRPVGAAGESTGG